jgi:hypothetical protein
VFTLLFETVRGTKSTSSLIVFMVLHPQFREEKSL